MLIQGNALRIPLASGSVGVILTSPPYNVGLNYDGYDDNLPEKEFKQFNRKWIYQAYNVMKDGGRMYVAVSDKMRYWIRVIAEDCGWTWVQDLTWCKPNMVGRTGVEYEWAMMSEPIMLFRKGKRSTMLNGAEFAPNTFNWFIETVPQSNFREGRIHPAQFPLSLCLRILSRTPGEPILDPFAGSGSVCVAAKMLGRSCLGIDIVDSVVVRANKRLRDTPEPLFVPQPEQMDLL